MSKTGSRISSRAFDRTIRELRQGRGLSLRDVESLSARVAPDSAGTISQPYLSQLESGRSVAISLPKLLTLAAIYDVRVLALLEDLPTRQRKSLEVQLEQWRNEGRAEPLPVHYLPAVVETVNAEIDEALLKISSRSMVELRFASQIQDVARQVLSVCVVTPFIQTKQGRRMMKAFWRIASDRQSLPIAPPDERLRVGGWHPLVSDFIAWLLYDKRLGLDLLTRLKQWSIIGWPETVSLMPTNELVSCGFSDPDLQEQYGFEGLPASLVYGARWREIAYWFHIMFFRRNQHLQLSPSPKDAAIDYLLSYVAHCPVNPAQLEHARFSSVPGAAAALAQLGEQNTSGGLSTNDRSHREAAEFLARADGAQEED